MQLIQLILQSQLGYVFIRATNEPTIVLVTVFFKLHVSIFGNYVFSCYRNNRLRRDAIILDSVLSFSLYFRFISSRDTQKKFQ